MNIKTFFEYWIYPGYYLRNFLFNRYDIIKLKEVKPYEYMDTDKLILYANMKLLCDFVEKEQPEKYICWYKDKEGEDCGPKYGELKDYHYTYPEMNGKWIMDIIKEIYQWWTIERPILLNDEDYILTIWAKYINGEIIIDDDDKDDEELTELKFDTSKCCKTLEDFNKVVNWDILDKYLDGDRKNILIKDFLHNKHNELRNKIFNEEQKYLHLIIDIRYCLWT